MPDASSPATKMGGGAELWSGLKYGVVAHGENVPALNVDVTSSPVLPGDRPAIAFCLDLLSEAYKYQVPLKEMMDKNTMKTTDWMNLAKQIKDIEFYPAKHPDAKPKDVPVKAMKFVEFGPTPDMHQLVYS